MPPSAFLGAAPASSSTGLRSRSASELAAAVIARGEGAVPIRPYLEGEAFEHEFLDTMSHALADACRELGLKDKEDAAVRLLAMRIIAEAKQGIHDRASLKAAATKGLGPSHSY